MNGQARIGIVKDLLNSECGLIVAVSAVYMVDKVLYIFFYNVVVENIVFPAPGSTPDKCTVCIYKVQDLSAGIFIKVPAL